MPQNPTTSAKPAAKPARSATPARCCRAGAAYGSGSGNGSGWLASVAALLKPFQLLKFLKFLLLVGLASTSAAAQQTVPSATEHAMRAWAQQTHDWLEQQLAATVGQEQGLRPEVVMGSLDSRLRLAHCARVQPYLPTGTRLWGRTRVGLRCTEGPVAWHVFVPVTIRAWGPAWSVSQPVLAGTRLSENLVEQVEIDWAAGVTPALSSPTEWLGLEASRNLVPGQVLRRGMVRAPQVFSAGTQVKVLLRGQGFQLVASGSALSHGHLGQPARVRMPNRKVLTGTVVDAETVEIIQ